MELNCFAYPDIGIFILPNVGPTDLISDIRERVFHHLKLDQSNIKAETSLTLYEVSRHPLVRAQLCSY